MKPKQYHDYKGWSLEAVLKSIHHLSFEQKYKKKKYQIFFFLSENFQFLVMKFSIYIWIGMFS